MADERRTAERPEADNDDSKAMPAAGPHAKPELTNSDATPGAGSLPDEGKDGDADGGTG